MILAVDDQPQNLRLLDAVLSPHGYQVITASSGEEAVEKLGQTVPDLVLLDIVMPGIDGYEVCRRIRGNPATEFLPVVMITASGDQEKISAIQAGADDFVSKPFNQGELLARVASLARVKRYHDTINSQAAELRKWNAELELRVAAQVEALERVNRLRRFLSPQLVDLVMDSGDEGFLHSHRREIVVVFCDLRGFTPFAETSEPEEVMGVLREYHEALGTLIFAHGGTLERFTGDGLMVFFNDPLPIDDAPERAIRMSVAMRDRVRELAVGWQRRGHDLALGIGIAQGFATLGRIGFEGRFDYAAIGSVTNLAARLCDIARPWQVLASQRVFHAAEPVAAGEQIDELHLKGLSRPVRVFDINEVNDDRKAGTRNDRALIKDDLDEDHVLSDLDDSARQHRFEALQQRMQSVWDAWKLDLEDESVVIVPSVTVIRAAGAGSAITQAFEERLLFLLLLLRQPALRMVYVTSTPVNPRIVEYYLALLPGVIPSHAMARLTLISADDSSDRPLTSEAAGPSPAARSDRRPHPQPLAFPPHPLQHHPARARPRAGPRHSHVRRGSATRRPRHQDRMPPAVRRVRRRASAGGRRPAQPRRGDRCDRRDVGRPAVDQPGDHQDQRGSLGHRQRVGRPGRGHRPA